GVERVHECRKAARVDGADGVAAAFGSDGEVAAGFVEKNPVNSDAPPCVGPARNLGETEPLRCTQIDVAINHRLAWCGMERANQRSDPFALRAKAGIHLLFIGRELESVAEYDDVVAGERFDGPSHVAGGAFNE